MRSFKTDAEGNLWVADYLRPGEEQRHWTVFDPEGRIAGTLIAPPRLKLLEIGSDYILGSARDELDVERVVLHRLIKNGQQ
jgi:sugar lactone lactonase YvrE